jgi:F0F1-type ATP synthase alpha subunit
MSRVLSIADGVARVSGLPDARMRELVTLPDGGAGLITALESDAVIVELLDGDRPAPLVGEAVTRTGRLVDVPVGATLRGRVIDPLGRPLDGGPPVPDDAPRRCLHARAPLFSERASWGPMLWTGHPEIDLLRPPPRGQVKAIYGPPGSGKTTLAIDTVLYHRDAPDLDVIWVGVGQDQSSVAAAAAVLRAHGAGDRVTFITAPATSPALVRLAPLAGISIAEASRAAGRHALLVWDLVRPATMRPQLYSVVERAGATRTGTITAFLLFESAPYLDNAADDVIALDGRTRRLDILASGVTHRRFGSPLRGWGFNFPSVLLQHAELTANQNDLERLAYGERVLAAIAPRPYAPVPIEETIVTAYAVYRNKLGSADATTLLAHLRAKEASLLASIRAAEGLKGHLESLLDAALRRAVVVHAKREGAM